MTSLLRALELRRLALVQRCAAQRSALALAAYPFTSKLAAADRLGASARAHPIALAFGLGALMVVGGRRLMRWAVRGLTLLSLARRVL